jgi:hypothetical protein
MTQIDSRDQDTEWYSLIMRCPACLSEQKEPGPAAQWYHAPDDGMVQVGSSAQYRCTTCQHVEHVKSWRYACEQHETDFRPTSSAHLANALSTAGQITSVAGRQWMQKFLENLGEW